MEGQSYPLTFTIYSGNLGSILPNLHRHISWILEKLQSGSSCGNTETCVMNQNPPGANAWDCVYGDF